jgi:hypothetical protein
MARERRTFYPPPQTSYTATVALVASGAGFGFDCGHRRQQEISKRSAAAPAPAILQSKN